MLFAFWPAGDELKGLRDRHFDGDALALRWGGRVGVPDPIFGTHAKKYGMRYKTKVNRGGEVGDNGGTTMGYAKGATRRSRDQGRRYDPDSCQIGGTNRRDAGPGAKKRKKLANNYALKPKSTLAAGKVVNSGPWGDGGV